MYKRIDLDSRDHERIDKNAKIVRDIVTVIAKIGGFITGVCMILSVFIEY